MEPHGRKAHDAEQAIVAKRTLMESYRAARSEAKSAGQEAPTFEQFMAARAPPAEPSGPTPEEVKAQEELKAAFRLARADARMTGATPPTFQEFRAARMAPAVVVPPAPIVVVEAEGATSEVNIVTVEVEGNESDAVSEPDLTPSE